MIDTTTRKESVQEIMQRWKDETETVNSYCDVTNKTDKIIGHIIPILYEGGEGATLIPDKPAVYVDLGYTVKLREDPDSIPVVNGFAKCNYSEINGVDVQDVEIYKGFPQFWRHRRGWLCILLQRPIANNGIIPVTYNAFKLNERITPAITLKNNGAVSENSDLLSQLPGY